MTTPRTSTLTAVFVYGTLKPGHHNYRVAQLAGPHTHEPASLGGFTLHTLGPFPGIKRTGIPWDTVQGHLITYDNIHNALPVLDRLEGVPALYTRDAVTVDLPSGLMVRCWTYVYAYPEKLTDQNLIETGEWTK